MTAIEVQGFNLPQFDRVRETFIRNFEVHQEIGASVAVFHHGRPVVDIWAGSRDVAAATPWESGTIVNFWSATKGINAICFAMLVDRGLASYEDKVSTYWPEFGSAGKQDITIGMLLAHQAGLSGFLEPATVDDLVSGEPAAARLAAQAPMWEIGNIAGYHGMTLGVLATALFRRIEGRPLKQFVEEEIAKPFGLDLSIGVRPGQESRVAQMDPVPAVEISAIDPSNVPQYMAFSNPPTPGALSNDPRWYAADLSSANGYGNARALARLYDLTLHAPQEGPALVGKSAIAQAAQCRYEGVDIVKGSFTRWSAGFWLNPGENMYGPNLDAYGFSGWGGSFGFADPVSGIAAAYTMNHMSDRFDLDPRRRGLINAVFASL